MSRWSGLPVSKKIIEEVFLTYQLKCYKNKKGFVFFFDIISSRFIIIILLFYFDLYYNNVYSMVYIWDFT